MSTHRIIFSLLFYCLLGFFSPSDGLAQKTKVLLKREREQYLKKIKTTERILSETNRQKENSLGKLNALNQRIIEQEKLIQSIQNEINLLSKEIDGNAQLINALENDLSQLKKEYALMVATTQKASGKIEKIIFLFSSKSFYQFLMRLKHMEQYSIARKNQAKVITRIQRILIGQVNENKMIKREKNTLLTSQTSEKSHLLQLKKTQRRVIQSLEKEEKKFTIQLAQTRNAIDKLNKLIRDIINKEIEDAKREARLAKKKKKSSTSTILALSTSFQKNKSKFSWPATGFIVQHFGKQKHPLIKRVIIQNDGINIQTQKDAEVQAIFSGEVRAIAFIPSIGNSVIIAHGNYYSVYSGLKDIVVKQGQRVKIKEKIGRVLANIDGMSELRFQIRKNTVALDPEAWLRK